MRANAVRALRNYKKRTSPSSGSHRSPRTSASLMRLRGRAHRAVAASKQYNETVYARNVARIKKMMKEIANYEARRSHKLVRQPSGSYSLARRT
jgi:hypothetical protein